MTVDEIDRLIKETQLEQLTAEVRKVCSPELEITVIPTQYRRELVIVRFPSQEIDIDDWAVAQVHPLHWNKINPLFEMSKQKGGLRGFYCCGNDFVLYSPDIKVDVFENFPASISYSCYGFFERQKYVGRCESIDELIAFLIQTPRLCF